jgi:hypothetical protein
MTSMAMLKKRSRPLTLRAVRPQSRSLSLALSLPLSPSLFLPISPAFRVYSFVCDWSSFDPAATCVVHATSHVPEVHARLRVHTCCTSFATGLVLILPPRVW